MNQQQVEAIILDRENIKVDQIPADMGGTFTRRQVWCNHCTQYVNVLEEAQNHVNMFRATRSCNSCGQFCFLDGVDTLLHKRNCFNPTEYDIYPNPERYVECLNSLFLAN